MLMRGLFAVSVSVAARDCLTSSFGLLGSMTTDWIRWGTSAPSELLRTLTKGDSFSCSSLLKLCCVSSALDLGGSGEKMRFSVFSIRSLSALLRIGSCENGVCGVSGLD